MFFIRLAVIFLLILSIFFVKEKGAEPYVSIMIGILFISVLVEGAVEEGRK